MDNILVYVIGLICGGILALGLLALGIYLIYAALSSRKKAVSSQGWPSVSGTITRADVEQSTTTDADGDTTTWYTPVVEYDYEVLGKPFHGKRAAFGAASSYSSDAKARATLAVYQPGASVPVFYNPLKPEEAVLEQKARSTNGMLAAGIILVVMTVCGGLVALIVVAVNLFKQL